MGLHTILSFIQIMYQAVIRHLIFCLWPYLSKSSFGPCPVFHRISPCSAMDHNPNPFPLLYIKITIKFVFFPICVAINKTVSVVGIDSIFSRIYASCTIFCTTFPSSYWGSQMVVHCQSPRS